MIRWQLPVPRFARMRRSAAMICTAMMLGYASVALAGPIADRASEHELARCIRAASDGKPWLEKTLWALRDQEGGWIGAQVRNSNGSHDLGPLQVNSWWVAKIATATGRPAQHVRWWLTHDACFNVNAARWIFLSGLRAHGDYWQAVGVYHSPTPWRQRRYAVSVSRHLRQRYGEQVFAAKAVRHSD